MIVLAAIALVALETVPGVPSRLQPLTRYKQWRAESFLVAAMEARERGDLNAAQLGLSSALTLNPRLTAARIQLARLLVETDRLFEGAAEAGKAGMNGPNFVHDMLLYSGRFDALLAFSARQVDLDREHEGVWLQSALMVSRLASAETRAHVRRSLPAQSSPGGLMLDAILLAADARLDETEAQLEARTQLSELNPAETLLGVELFVQADAPQRAWVWLNRHRGRLSDFDARCADYRVESARDPRLALHILESIPALPLTDARWVRLAAAVTAGGNSDAATAFCRLLATARPHPEAPLAVSAWALLLLHGNDNAAGDWENHYRRTGAEGLPVLVGRRLDDPERTTRSQAVRLLSSTTPLPREMIAALLAR